MGNPLERTELLLGKEKVDHLKRCHIAVFGLGGVGSYAVEALARTGVGALTVIDCDVFSESNLNRQLCATVDTVGRRKTEVTKERIAAVAPQCRVTAVDLFYTPDNGDSIDLTQFDYIIDAIDTVTSKIDLICRATAANIPIISSMGTGNKLDPTKLAVTDLYKTQGCPLARILRRELKKRNIPHLKVVYSEEEPKKTVVDDPDSTRHAPGSAVFVPACAGFILAAETVKDLTKKE
ncbi:MAG: tRNA threonylcarbamoyladenosine dehydratase [Clostridia bacterium]|nr:tRNA threonylcarbamoyladenosine dehydratase [Clostridia bacterium]